MTPTLNQVVEMLDRAFRLAKNPSPLLQAQALRLLDKAERAIAGGARLEPEVTCQGCLRDRRAWFATAVAWGELYPLCSRACIGYWQDHRFGRIYVRGREWIDELGPTRATEQRGGGRHGNPSAPVDLREQKRGDAAPGVSASQGSVARRAAG